MLLTNYRKRSVIWIIQDWLKDVVSPFPRRLGFLLEGKYLNKTSCKAIEVLPVRLVILGTKLSQSLGCSLAKQNCAAGSVTQKIVQKSEFIPFSAFLCRKQQSSSVSDAEWARVMSACLEFMFNSFSGAWASIKCDKATAISSSTSVKTKLWRSFLVPWWQWKGEIIGMDAFRTGPTALGVLWYRAA